MSIRATAIINTTRQDKRLGKISKRHKAQVNGTMLCDTLHRLEEKILDKFDRMPDDEVVAWTDVQISLQRTEV